MDRLARRGPPCFVSVLTKAYSQSKDRNGWAGWELHIHNGGALPIRLGGAFATITMPHGIKDDDLPPLPFEDQMYQRLVRQRDHFMSVPRRDELTYYGAFSTWPKVIEGGETKDVRIVLTGDMYELGVPAQNHVAIQFSDANGRWWTRSAIGELKKRSRG